MMESQNLLLIILTVCILSLILEKQLSWVSHFSGICISILVAIILSSLGLIPREHQLYDFFMGPIVPLAIALLIFGLNLKSLSKIPRSLLKIFGVGLLASMSGGLIMALVTSQYLGENGPKLAAQLTASYIGGNENAVAISKILGIPNHFFIAALSVDNVVTSIWMAITIATTGSKLTHIETDDTEQSSYDSTQFTIIGLLSSIALGLLAVKLSELANRVFGIFHPLLYLTLVSLLISRHPVVQRLIKPAYVVGTAMFAPFFFSAGAISDIRALGDTPLAVLIMPFMIVGIHGVIIFSAGKFLKVPSCEISLASQALVGGSGTAVALAQVKNWRSGVMLGMALGLVGYTVANFCGVFVYQASMYILRWAGVPL